MSVEESILNHGKDAIKQLKKILASKGSIQGNFYFAGDSRGKYAGIVVTISTRDPKGSKVLAQGKGLRSEIPGAKFARGLVRSDGKLWLEVVAGNAKESLLKKAFKSAFSDKALNQLKNFLRKARFGNPTAGDVVEEEPEADSVEEIDVDALESEMDAEELADFALLKAQESQLVEVNQSLQEGFLSVQDAEKEERAYQREMIAKIEQLSKNNPGDPALQTLRYALAETLYNGPDPFPEVGEAMAPEMVQVLQASIQNSLNALKSELDRVAQDILDRRSTADTKPEADRAEFSGLALQALERHPDLMQALLSQIHNMTQ